MVGSAISNKENELKRAISVEKVKPDIEEIDNKLNETPILSLSYNHGEEMINLADQDSQRASKKSEIIAEIEQLRAELAEQERQREERERQEREEQERRQREEEQRRQEREQREREERERQEREERERREEEERKKQEKLSEIRQIITQSREILDKTATKEELEKAINDLKELKETTTDSAEKTT